VTSGAAASRYARALFDVVSKESPANVEKAQGELQEFADLLQQHHTLASVLGNPAVPASKKVAVVQAILDKSGAVTPPLAKLLLLLADRDRLMLLPALARAYRERVMDFQQIVRGDVTTPAPLAPEKLRALESGLQRATGRKVVLDAKVDPSIIGGAITRIGSTVYDGSVTTQLQKMKQALVEAGQ
jgi:F-type H+-transporting ATPase subunit delta